MREASSVSNLSPKVDIDTLRNEIVARLKKLDPRKIILFGSYASGTASDESDIDLFLIKDDLLMHAVTSYEVEAMKSLQDLVARYQIGFDVLAAPTEAVYAREDYFYKVEILQKGKVLYAK